MFQDKGTLDKSLQFWQQEKLPSEKTEKNPVERFSRETTFMQSEPLVVETYFDEESEKYDCSVDLNECYRKYGDTYVPIETIMFRNKGPVTRSIDSSHGGQTSLSSTVTKTFAPSKTSVRFLPGKQVLKCHQCQQADHALWNCKEYVKLGHALRMRLVKEKALCLRCLNTGHQVRDCKVRFFCDVEKCGKKHHRLLHPYTITKQTVLMFVEQGIGSDISDDDFPE